MTRAPGARRSRVAGGVAGTLDCSIGRIVSWVAAAQRLVCRDIASNAESTRVRSAGGTLATGAMAL